MITTIDFLYKIKNNIETQNFNVGFMSLGGSTIICSNLKKKHTPKTISVIYNKYLKQIKDNPELNTKNYS